MKNKYTILFIVMVFGLHVFSQTDSLKSQKASIELNTDTSYLFQHKKQNNTEISEPIIEIGAYVSSYYALYTQDETVNFVKHATMAPRNNQFGLNMAMMSFNYKSNLLRSNVTFHYGDVAESTWPAKFNMVQEANTGVQLFKNCWLDAGFFRSHIGLESTQPRENITSSMSLANVYEPYYFSGAKLTYALNQKISLQLNAFNSFSSFIETNKNKLIGTTIVFTPNDNTNITYNFITGDDTPDSVSLKHQRYYHNIYATYQKNKFTLGVEFNYGIQDYSKQKSINTVTTAFMNSSLVVAKHQTFKKTAFYGRAEWFSDENEILSVATGMGKYTYGGTFGVEYKPLKNVALSIESRYLQSEKNNFNYNNKLQKSRTEGIFCLDVWF